MAINVKTKKAGKDGKSADPITATRERRVQAWARRPDTSGLTLTLPTTRSEPLKSLDDFAVLVYGPPGCGKTTLAGQFEKCFHMLFEPGGGGTRLFQRYVTQWPEAVGYVDLLETNKEGFKNVCVDVTEKAWHLYFDWFVLNRLGGQHPSQLKDRGASWAELRREFEVSFFHRLLGLPLGTLWVSHERRIMDEEGDEVLEIRPDLSGQPWSIVEGMMDVIIWYDVHNGQRALLLDGFDQSPRVATKNRLEENFRTVDGDRVKWIPAGHTKEETYQNLLRAFRNEQRYADRHEAKRLKVRTKK